ncbi:MAG: glutaredoxin domain-containing protein [bacterium]|nr:glutaredoxin domain-containing protein [bacterium]MDA1024496.1 glutaredoxin domain-containing protein [bacterium]
MKNITIYTQSYCMYCQRAKYTLRQEGFDFEEIDITENPQLRTEIQVKTGMYTMPQIFVGEEFIGGSDDLDRHIEEVRAMMRW